MHDELIFAEEGNEPSVPVRQEDGAWKVLIIDDQEDIHNVTRLVLSDLAFEGRPVSCLSAYSGAEALELLRDRNDIAVMLLDVVMETPHAGLNVARFVRSDLNNRLVRIILRTGQPGEAPERDVVTDLDINDYRSKTELTSERLTSSVITAIRSFRDLKALDESRNSMHHLAMSVAHQIRNRTVTIGGFANIIKRSRSLPSEMGEHLATIMEESARLESMVGDVTRYAAIRLGPLKPASIRELLEAAMDKVSAGSADNEDIHWDVLCPDQTILVDPALFVMAVEALLQNCLDFSPRGSRVSIKARTARLACTLEIVDSGIGIVETDLPHVFNPFFTHKPDGSGMGLAIVRKVALEHQWDIDLRSEPGVGTKVTIIIPRREYTGRG